MVFNDDTIDGNTGIAVNGNVTRVAAFAAVAVVAAVVVVVVVVDAGGTDAESSDDN